MREKIIEKIRDNIKLSREENSWLNRMVTSPKVLGHIMKDILKIKLEYF